MPRQFTSENKNFRSFLNLFNRLYARAGLTRYQYQNCGCVVSKRQECEWWVKICERIIHYPVPWDRDIEICRMAHDYIRRLQPDCDAEFIAELKSRHRLSKPVKKSEITFFQTVNAAAQITKQLATI
jgi:hypothetical protein